MLCKLISIRLRGIFAKSAMRNGKKSKAMVIVFPLLMLYCVGVFGALFYHLFSQLAGVLYATPFAWFFFALVGLMSFGISFFFTAFTAKSELFEAKDDELLLSLPIRPRTILLSRMSILLLSEYLFSFLVMIPAGIAWGSYAGFGFVPRYVLGCLSLPLLSAALACVLGWLLALITARVRRKNLLTMLFSLAFLAIYFYVYFNTQNYVNQILVSYQQISEGMMGWGFLFHWFGVGIAEADYALLGSVIGISLVIFAVASWLLSLGFLRISSGGRTVVGKKRSGKAVFRAVTLEKALRTRERKRFFSSPVYMLNSGLGILMTLVATVAALIKVDALRALVITLQNSMQLSNLTLSFFGALLIASISAMNTITAPSVSLEGKTLWILRSAPITAEQILHAKLYTHLLLVSPSALLLSAVIGFVLQAEPIGWVLLLLLPQIFVLLSAAFGLMMNLLMPKLDWTNEAVPVKQSMSTLVTMLGLMLLPIVLIAGLLLLGLSVKLYILASILLCTLLTVLCLLWLERRGARRFDRL